MILAHDILTLLATKHSKDVFIPECKTGPTHGARMQMLDAWVMNRSWAHATCYGYEIKVARSDFLGDDKWRGYLPYCNCFSFVCPPKLIAVEECPDGCGLYWTSVNGGRLFTKRKPPFREVDIPDSLWRYILMARTYVGREYEWNQRTQWEAWLAEKDEKKRLGQCCSKKLGELVQERITNVEAENRKLKDENKALASVRAVCDAMKISPGSVWNIEDSVKQALKRLQGGKTIATIDRVTAELAQVRSVIEQAGCSER